VHNFNTKINLLEHLLKKNDDFSKVLIFCNNKKHADLLYTKIEELFPDQFDVIHSNKSQNYRLNAMRSFENQKVRGLITTDIMARGLDISDITHVINFEIPDVQEQYIHRIGRTGRADKEGTAVSFVTKLEETLLLDIELLMNKEVVFKDFPTDVKQNPVKIASEKDEIVMKNANVIKLEECCGDFQEKYDKNKKETWCGPHA
jgi:ATP-dependent RNA helicase RhlE